jgi:histidine triad (HIT) family protein
VPAQKTHASAERAEDCVFCRIAARQDDAKIVFEDDVSMAFLDSRPLFPGHTLLISKTHYETIADIPKDLIGRLFSNTQDLAAVVKGAMQAEGTFVAVNNTVSQSVPHFHVHIVPRRRRDGLRGFFWPRHGYSSEEEMAAVRDVLSSRLKKSISNPSS